MTFTIPYDLFCYNIKDIVCVNWKQFICQFFQNFQTHEHFKFYYILLRILCKKKWATIYSIWKCLDSHINRVHFVEWIMAPEITMLKRYSANLWRWFLNRKMAYQHNQWQKISIRYLLYKQNTVRIDTHTK